jgi:hypothetical protein
MQVLEKMQNFAATLLQFYDKLEQEEEGPAVNDDVESGGK